MKSIISLLPLLMAALTLTATAFAPSVLRQHHSVARSISHSTKARSSPVTFASSDDDGVDTSDATKASLEEKMMSWEATEEELKAKSLGGVTVTPNADREDAERTDAFDIGLWIMFPFMVGTGLLFFVFPFIMDKIDVSSVGPPPMI